MLDAFDPHGVGLPAISAGPAHRATAAECRGAGGAARRHRHRPRAGELPLRCKAAIERSAAAARSMMAGRCSSSRAASARAKCHPVRRRRGRATPELRNCRVRGNYMIVDRCSPPPSCASGRASPRSASASPAPMGGRHRERRTRSRKGREPDARCGAAAGRGRRDRRPAAHRRAGRADAAAARASARHPLVAQSAGRARTRRQPRRRWRPALCTPDPQRRQSGTGTLFHRQPQHAGWPERSAEGL